MGEISLARKYGYSLFRISGEENASEIKLFQVELEKNRTKDENCLMESVTKVRGDLESLKVDVSNNFTEGSRDYFKRRMFDMGEKIRNQKEAIKEKLFTLIVDERRLEKELNFFQKRIHDWEKPLNSHMFMPLKQSCYKIDEDVSNPAGQFQKFLSSSGGHSGGWNEQDHLLFLRQRKRYRRKEKFLSAIHSLLPDFSYEEIAQHENWYLKYESLKNSQKEAIQKWKLEKVVQPKEKEKVAEQEEKKSVKTLVRQKGNIAERIQEWKTQKMLKKLEEEEREKKEKAKIKEEERKKKEIQEMKKSAVTQYKAEKISKLQGETLLKEKPSETRERKSILLKAFRLQDIKFIEKKKMIRLQVESKCEKLRFAKPALEVLLKRDPQRIFQPTLNWNQHCLEVPKRERTDPVFDLNAISRLAIPEWRRELK